MINANVNLTDAPKTAPMATSANAPGERLAPGISRLMSIAKIPPIAAPIMNTGASNPPEVLVPSESIKATNLKTSITRRTVNVKWFSSMAPMVSYPGPKYARDKIPERSNPKRSDGWEDIGAKMELLELVFCPVKGLYEEYRRKPTDHTKGCVIQ